MILATDLDGTFLGGSADDRKRLYSWIQSNHSLKVVFVTGRGVESVVPLLEDESIPTPEFVICDVGSTVVETKGMKAVESIQRDIESRWPGKEKVLSVFSKYPELVLQEVPQERRCSFFISSMQRIDDIKKDAELLHCDMIYSAGKFIDILPRNVNKGSTLKKLINQLNYPKDSVLVAGDTLNDLHMFSVGYKGVVVGNAEPLLLNSTKSIPHIYEAKAPGAGGIYEAFQHFNLAAASPVKKQNVGDQQTVELSAGQLVMVYHRFPYEIKMVDGKKTKVKPKSPNGILPTLESFFSNGRHGLWIAWEESQDSKAELGSLRIDEKMYPNLHAAPVGLTKNEIDVFYKRFSKEALWPILFSFIDKVKFNHHHWAIFKNVNKRFADKVISSADPGALVWIHDYNLWLVPGMIRASRPDLKISFFHHTPFPPASIFNILPWRGEIIQSLLACDHVGFHIPSYIENFVDVARSHFDIRIKKEVSAKPKFLTHSAPLGVKKIIREIISENRTIRLSANPVGIDINRIERILDTDKVRKNIDQFRKIFSGQQIVLSVERLDYVKGPVEKILAFEKFLDENPEFHGKLTLINICTPAADGMKIYESTKHDLEQAVGRINGKYSRIDWVPIRLFFKSVPFEEVVSYYALAKIAWITPLRDGLNLVAKEFAATQGMIKNAEGVLILSEFAGVSVDLHHALLTNPYDIESLKNSIYKALHMPADEVRKRIRLLYRQVKQYDIHHWAKSYVENLDQHS